MKYGNVSRVVTLVISEGTLTISAGSDIIQNRTAGFWVNEENEQQCIERAIKEVCEQMLQQIKCSTDNHSGPIKR